MPTDCSFADQVRCASEQLLGKQETAPIYPIVVRSDDPDSHNQGISQFIGVPPVTAMVSPVM